MRRSRSPPPELLELPPVDLAVEGFRDGPVAGHQLVPGEGLPAVPGGPYHGCVDILDAEVGRPHTRASRNALPQPGNGITTEGAHGIPARLGAELGAALAARANLWGAVNVFPEDGDPFFAELQKVYDDIGEGLPADATRPRPSELPDDHEETERTGLFEHWVHDLNLL